MRFDSISQVKQKIYDDYKAHHNRKLNTKATAIREASVNLDSHHTMKDMLELKKLLEDKYKYTVLHIAIHRDEGHIDKDTNKEKINYHAHVIVHNYDFSTHRTIKRDTKVMSELQTDVADTLKMQRGEVGSTKTRLNHRQYRRAQEIAREQTLALRAELKQARAEKEKLAYDYREMQRKITALEISSEEKKELHRENTELRKLVKSKDSTIEEQKKKLADLTKTVRYYRESYRPTKEKELENARERTNELKEQVSMLERENVDLHAILSTERAEKEELKQEVSKLQAIVDKVSSFFSCRTSELVDKVTSFFSKKSEISSSSPLERSDIKTHAEHAPSASVLFSEQDDTEKEEIFRRKL
jgi:DNA repair exonuclease SbcCD ATPase subunit